MSGIRSTDAGESRRSAGNGALVALLAVILPVVTACTANVGSVSVGPGAVRCQPGAMQVCACPGGASAMQTCNPDGQSLTLCACAGGLAGNSGGVGNAGTSGGLAGNGGAAGQAGTFAAAGAGGSGGSGGVAGSGLDGGAMDSGNGQDAAIGGNPETGRLAGITAAHNMVRANVKTPVPNPALPPLTWSDSLAATAQAYANKLATTGGCQLVHSMTPGLGENLAYYGGQMATPAMVVDGWASEVDCWTYGKFMQTDACNATCVQQHFSNGCGHYTQVVWRSTTMVGCGEADCTGSQHKEIWVCNYKAQGNYINEYPY